MLIHLNAYNPVRIDRTMFIVIQTDIFTSKLHRKRSRAWPRHDMEKVSEEFSRAEYFFYAIARLRLITTQILQIKIVERLNIGSSI